ncbi:PREDICTED: WD repeat-containing protein on Y chromosome-like [Hipposideros armiger]|uniref:WD repeat-containing protein on Y chromosome n=1 Tax=Hipposideros armiger TaxID=186990 RepID=A0A8B7RK18_HIPAR|nr:PREDICTED: WD repeat-containing protein on Y chromosome-like [Hipposideros armiger]
MDGGQLSRYSRSEDQVKFALSDMSEAKSSLEYASFFMVMDALATMVFNSLGAAYVVMAGITAINGLVVAVLIANSLNEGLSLYRSFLQLGAGLSNIRVWDLQDYVCLHSFCGKLFGLGNCPITSAYCHKNDNTLICSTYSIGILKGCMDTQGPRKPRKNTTYDTPLCAVLYSKIFKQVVSGCLSGVVSVWDISTGNGMMEFSVTGDQQVELTAMSLDEPERCLLTGLRDGTIKMWNYSTGKCLLTFPNPDKLEISGVIHMNKVFYVTGWSKRITYYMFHKAMSVLSCQHWQTFHTEDVLSMAKYQNHFLGTSSYNGDILFWNVNMFKPILKFNASDSPLPLLPKKVQQERDNFLVKRHRPSEPVVEQKWALKTSKWPLGPSPKTVANANLRQNLTSAPPVMRHPRDKEPAGPVPLQKSPLNAVSPKQFRMFYDKQPFFQEAERRKGDLQKMLLQSNTSVEKIIFLQSRPRLPHTATLMSSCIDGYIYAWSIHGNGGLLGKFPVDLNDNRDVVVGAMATDENDWILVTGDCKGYIKIWDIKDYCAHADGQSSPPSGTNQFRLLIPKSSQIDLPDYIPLEDKEVVAGQTISLVPPKLLIAWKGHLDSVSDILYVNSFQLVISAGQDWNVKAWKLSGDAIGTFGLSLWERLQDVQVVGDHELHKRLKKEDGSIDASQKAHPEMQDERDFAEALVYQRREQVALMSLLNGKADTEDEAWAKLQKITLTSPWAGERSPEAIEKSWYILHRSVTPMPSPPP